MSRILFVLLLLTAASWPNSARAQAGWLYVQPAPTFENQLVNLWIALPRMDCFNEVRTQTLTRTASGFRVEYASAEADEPICFTVMPPLHLEFELGLLPPGEYTVELVGTHEGAADPDRVARFVVQAGYGEVPRHAVPALDPRGRVLLALACVALAMLTLRRR